MALFNKLFSNRRGAHNKHQDNASEKFFAFSKDQVRLLLFKECDFRGRKLLFDSSSIKKVPVTFTKSGDVVRPDENEKFSEITNGYGYVYTKPQSDFGQLAEMVFGSVAMSFRGTYFKMHDLETPNRLMFTQVFSSLRATNRVSVSSRSLEHSKFDDSGASSAASISDHLSVHSTASDTVLVCRRRQSSPLDVPTGSKSIPSLVGDSGCCVDAPPWGSTSTLSLSSSSLYKRWLRRTSASLEGSNYSFASSMSNYEGRSHRSGKLGLALVLQLTPGQEEELSQFLMEHVYLLEAMLWRARQVVEVAFLKTNNFASLMVEVAQISTQYLVNLLSGSYLSVNLWLSLSSGCDNYNSISAFSDKLCESNSSGFFKDADSEFHLFNFTRFLKSDPFKGEHTVAAERFVQEFCELLEDVDVKDTNFFMSTLLTAVLTYHLGWVNTCLPSTDDAVLQSRHPFNPLWGELSDLYGAVGHPTKIAQTIITGSNKRDLISKILIAMTYFIRCCDVDRRVPIRVDVQRDNDIVEKICRTRSCIPKENYKKYEDHLKEIMDSNKEFIACCNNNNNYGFKNNESDTVSVKRFPGLVKTRTCLGTLTSLDPSTEEIFQVSSPSILRHVNPVVDLQMEKQTNDGDVVFVLGDDEQLVGIKKDNSTKQRPSFLNLKSSIFQDGDFIENPDKSLIKLSYDDSQIEELAKTAKKTSRCQSEPPEEQKPEEAKNKAKYRYSGVKFSLQQYPQILSSYMKRKNVEITNLNFGDKNMKLDDLSSLSDTIISKYPELDEEYEGDEALQTPSNASELEFTSDLFVAPTTSQPKSAETNCDADKTECGACYKMNAINLPMPKSKFYKSVMNPVKYTSSLMRAASDSYMPDMVLQGAVVPKRDWESKLKNDLALASQHPLIDQPVEEAVAVIANTDTWEVQLMSSHTFLIDKGSSGVRIGMSQLVSNMLESLLQMWKLKVPPHFCLMHIEQTLQELCIRSKALAELLLATEFCNMEQVTSALQLEVNDVPLLLAVASTHSPQVTQKYGLSFQ